MTGCSVLLDGTPIEALAQVRVRRMLSLPTTIEITLAGPVSECAPDASLGAAVEISMAAHDRAPTGVSAEIVTITEHHDASGVVATRIVAQDRLVRLRARHSQRSFLDQSVHDHATEILADVGLTLASEVDLGPVRRHGYQGGADDLDHLRAVLEQVGAYLCVDEATARAVSLTPSEEVVELGLGAELIELTRGVTASAAPAHVLASGWDLERAAEVAADVSAATGQLPWVDLRGSTPETEPAGTHQLLLDHDALDLAGLTAAASAALLRGRALAVPVEGRALDRPDLMPGVTCEFRDHGGVPIALGVLTLVDHRWSATGLISRLSTAPPASVSTLSPAATLVRGVVVGAADPAGRGRVQVRLPTHDDALSPWLDVLVPGGDADRGLVAIPRTGATVAVLLPGGDLGRGLVLGGVLGVDGFVVGVTGGDDVTRQVWHSSRHQFLGLDDAAGTVHLRNRGGSSLRLTTDSLELHAAGDMVIEAPGRTLRIRAAAVEFEEVPS